MVSVSLLFMAKTEDPFSPPSHSVAMALLPSHVVLLFITAPPLPLEGSVTVQGLS